MACHRSGFRPVRCRGKRILVDVKHDLEVLAEGASRRLEAVGIGFHDPNSYPLEPALRVLPCLSSPDPLHAVAVEGLVSADDGKTFDQGLRDDQTVEGIAVVKGHECHLADVSDVKRQHGDAVLA